MISQESISNQVALLFWAVVITSIPGSLQVSDLHSMFTLREIKCLGYWRTNAHIYTKQ